MLQCSHPMVRQFYYLRVAIPATLLLAGLVGGTYIGHLYWPIIEHGQIVRQPDNHYDFIDPIIGCEISTVDDFPELAGLRKSIEDDIHTATSVQAINTVSVYFRGLRSGRWINLNPTEKYKPASLLKLVTAIAHYKYNESVSGHLDTPVVVDSSADSVAVEDNIGPHDALKKGQSYTLGQLIDHLLIYSDNQANNLLIDKIDTAYIASTYKDLNIPLPETAGTSYITPENYSILFRTLFNATYLSRNDSQKLLQVMSRSTYNDALVQGIPQGMTISHKFGFRNPEDAADPTEKELHDCGIIYYPNHPYFLCVMTKGDDYASLTQTIATVSKTVYDWENTKWKAAAK